MANPHEPDATEEVSADQSSKEQSGVFRLLLEQHGEAFAMVKRLGMRSGRTITSELIPRTERVSLSMS